MDGSGLPLIPQPITSAIDPLNYPNVCFSTSHYDIEYILKMRIHKVAEISHPRSSVFSRRFVNTECRNHQSRRCATFQGIRHHPCTHNVHDDSGARYTRSGISYLHTICQCIRTTASLFDFSFDRGRVSSWGGHSNSSFGKLMVARAFTGLGPSARAQSLISFMATSVAPAR